MKAYPRDTCSSFFSYFHVFVPALHVFLVFRDSFISINNFAFDVVMMGKNLPVDWS